MKFFFVLFFVFFLLFSFYFSFIFYFSKYLDLSEFPFPSVSACPSLANSPIVARRDSILKHSGSVKNTDPNRRVSIKHQNQPIVLEYLSEKRHTAQSQQIPTSNGSMGKSNPRPASLVLTGDRPTYKLTRTPSIDQDDTMTNTTNFTDVPSTNQRNLSSTNSKHHFAATELNVKDDDDEDESAPLVQNQNLSNDLSKIGQSNNHS